MWGRVGARMQDKCLQKRGMGVWFLFVVMSKVFTDEGGFKIGTGLKDDGRLMNFFGGFI